MVGKQGPDMIGAGAIFIDDIVLPDGQTHMGQLGGGTVHALMGAVLWGERPGLSAYVGQGLPADVLPRLRRHLDTQGIVRLGVPQMRAWQLFEHDGTRREVHRVDVIAPFVTGTKPADLPGAYHEARAYYLLQDYAGIVTWQRQVDGMILWEPNALGMQPAYRDAFRAAVRDCPVTLISPNLQEAQTIYGRKSPDALLDAFFEDGAQAVALRLGAAGSLVGQRAGGRWRVGAVPVREVIDQTGAGNVYCGALLCGLMRGKTLQAAAMMGAVAASFCVETIGVLEPASIDPAERNRRYRALLT